MATMTTMLSLILFEADGDLWSSFARLLHLKSHVQGCHGFPACLKQRQENISNYLDPILAIRTSWKHHD